MGSSCFLGNSNKNCEVNLEKENDQAKYNQNISVNQNVIIINAKEDFKNKDSTSKINNRGIQNYIYKKHDNGFISTGKSYEDGNIYMKQINIGNNNELELNKKEDKKEQERLEIN